MLTGGAGDRIGPRPLAEGVSLRATRSGSLAEAEESYWNLPTQYQSIQDREPSVNTPQHPVGAYLRHRQDVLRRRGAPA